MDCARLAEVVSDPKAKATLLTMAEAWLRLADFVEQGERDPLCENIGAGIRSDEDPTFK